MGNCRLARLEEAWVLRYDETPLRRSLHGKTDKNQEPHFLVKAASGKAFQAKID